MNNSKSKELARIASALPPKHELVFFKGKKGSRPVNMERAVKAAYYKGGMAGVELFCKQVKDL